MHECKQGNVNTLRKKSEADCWFGTSNDFPHVTGNKNITSVEVAVNVPQGQDTVHCPLSLPPHTHPLTQREGAAGQLVGPVNPSTLLCWTQRLPREPRRLL